MRIRSHLPQSTLDEMNYFLGLNISDSPLNIILSAFESGAWLLLIGALAIPILSALTQWLNTKLIPQTSTGNDEENSMARSHENDE